MPREGSLVDQEKETMKTSSSLALSAGTATLLLLSGCGGDGTGGEANAMPSEKQPVTAETSVASPATTPVTKAGALANQNGIVPINGEGISGRMLTFLLSSASTHGGGVPEFYAHPAYPWSGAGPNGFVKLWELGRISKLYGGQTVGSQKLDKLMDDDPFHLDDGISNSSPENTPFEFQLGSWFGYDKRVQNGDFKSLDSELQLFFANSGYYMRNRLGWRYSYDGPPPAEQKILTLSPDAKAIIRTGAHDPSSAPAQEIPLKASAPLEIKAGDRFAFNKVLHEWRDAQGNFIQMMVLPGKHADEVRLCLNQQVSDIKRLNCTLWKTPADWGYSFNLIYQGLYVEDQSGNTSRKRYWQSTHKYPFMPVKPVSRIGVRGDALARALSTPITLHDETGEIFRNWTGNPSTGPFPATDRLNDDTIAGVEGWSAFRTQSPDYTGYFHDFDFSREVGPYQGANFDFDSVHAAMPFTARVGKLFKSSGFHEDKHLFTVDGDLSFNRTLLTLGEKLEVTVKDEKDEKKVTTLTLNANRSYRVRNGRPILYNRVIQRWEGEKDQYVQLVLMKGAKPDMFRLCVDQQLASIKRLSCSIWHVPADWKIDMPVEFRGIYVADNRRPLGEDRTLYWITKPEFMYDEY